VTSEDDFQKALDANPTDWQTRLVFADWLQEQGDARADGYRALAAGRFVLSDRYTGTPPRYVPLQTSRIFRDDGSSSTGRDYTLPVDWFECLPPPADDERPSNSIGFATRRKAEDAAALAFAKLPPERRSELLAGAAG
jgi:uncharacterized protein (TIGR02996 family)